MGNELWFACCWKMAMTALLAAVLVTSGASMLVEKNEASEIPLDMAPNSVDDMYTGCKDKMKDLVVKQYLKNESNNDANFKKAWNEAEKSVSKKVKKERRFLRMAIYVYTLDSPNIYLDFNEAVRTQKSEYNTTFKYHSLHFFLTRAVQTLNSGCLTGYRSVNSSFSQNVLNKEFRFGSFTSSSRRLYPNPTKFGNKTCFQINTCFGADISSFSKHESESEVLIPPYEVFKVTKIERSSEQNSLPCEVVYEVNTTNKNVSNLNCALF